MATDPRPDPQNDDARTGDADPGQRRDSGNTGTTGPGEGGGSATSPTPARKADPAKGRDLPDENGEPPSVKRPGGDPDASEPPVENF